MSSDGGCKSKKKVGRSDLGDAASSRYEDKISIGHGVAEDFCGKVPHRITT